jgi:hypothetical protein
VRRPALLALAVAMVAAVAFAAVGVAPAAGPHKAASRVRHRRPGHKPKPKGKPRPAPLVTRYGLVHGCYDIRAAGAEIAPADAPFRMQATTLGQYLLYGVHQDFVGPGFDVTGSPANDTVWQVNGDSRHGLSIMDLGGGAPVAVTFTPASGCAVYPEGDVDATGTTFTGTTPAGLVNGTIDAHSHVTAYEFLGGDFHCGRPWHPFGIAYALPDCASDETGTNGQIESFLDYGEPLHAHDTVGWPTFKAWPSPTDLAEEGDYWTGLERAWKAGLRIFVTNLVDNEALCELMTKRHNPCNDMDAVSLQAKDLRDLQDYIDAQFGGPGKGFFRIVTNPFQARQVINQGKLAVVEGIEVSDLFNCGEYLGTPNCDQAQVNAGLDEVQKLGVSTFFPVHKFDNAFGGTKMDGGELGLLVNGGNHLETGQFWNVQTCTGPEHDQTQLNAVPGGGLATILDGPVGKTLLPGLQPSSQVPVYPPAPHCNTRGLTPLGVYLLDQMVKRHLVVQLDHMDAKTADEALSVLEAQHYSGVVSAHSWDSPEENPRIYSLGGFITPIAGASPASFIAQWKATLPIRNPRFYGGFGYGADMNGLAEQSEPDISNPISYPFKSYDGRVTFTREQWGQRVFDLDRDGVANYGMYADWLQQLQLMGGKPLLSDMFRGAEAYLQMWERADGVPASSCRPAADRLSAYRVGPIRLGASFESVLFAAGQPASRTGRSYRWCVSGAPRSQTAAVFGSSGRVEMVASDARSVTGVRLRPGAAIGARLKRAARRVGAGLWLSRGHGGRPRVLYEVRGRRIAAVAAVAAGDARSASRLRGDLRAAGL